MMNVIWDAAMICGVAFATVKLLDAIWKRIKYKPEKEDDFYDYD